MNAIVEISSEIHTKVAARIDSMGRNVESMVNAAIEALLSFNQEQALSILEKEAAVNEMETLIHHEILDALGRGTTSMHEARQAAAMFRINNDLERLGDLTTGISRKLLGMAPAEVKRSPELEPIAIAVAHIARKTFQSLLHEDLMLGSNVLASGTLVDNYRAYVFERLEEKRGLSGERSEAAYLMLASRYLEQIADYCTNLAESLVFWLDGEKSRGQAA